MIQYDINFIVSLQRLHLGNVSTNTSLYVYATSTTNGTCLKCVFQDKTSRACVVVIHPKASKLLSQSYKYGLLNIRVENIYKSGDVSEIEDCFEAVYLENYTIVVFAFREMSLGPPVFVTSQAPKQKGIAKLR